MPGIQVDMRRPNDLPNAGRFKFKSSINLEDSATAEGSYAECYAFHKSVGEIKAILSALQQINCTGVICVTINYQGDVERGHIYAWDEASKLIAEEAASSITDLVRKINSTHGKCHLDLRCTISRAIK